jgi:hypothetical protein
MNDQITKVFIILRTDEDGSYIDSVFLDKKIAKSFFEENCYGENEWDNYEITEAEIIHKINFEKEKGYFITIDKQGEIVLFHKVNDEDLKTEIPKENYRMIYRDKLYLDCSIIARSKQEAIDRANKKRLELIENNQWCFYG